MENKVTVRNPITEGCIWKGMLLFALPIMLGSLLQQLYNTADAVIVGRALGKAALASVGGSSGRITNLLVNAFVALSSGASVIVAQHFGARDTQRVRRSICTAMLLSVVCGILLTVLGITSARQLLVWMQTTPEHSTPPPPICASSSSAWCRPCSTTWAAASCARWETPSVRFTTSSSAS